MLSPNTFCITGGTGFVGRHLISCLVGHQGYRIKYLSRKRHPGISGHRNVEFCHGDLLNPETLASFLEENAILIHLAYLANESPEVNLKATVNLISAAREAEIRRLIHCSTAVVVGKIDEQFINEDSRCQPLNEYEKTKLQIEDLLLREGSLSSVILRPTAIFGKGGRNLTKIIEDLCHGPSIKNYIRESLFQDRRLHLVSVDNVVEAISFLAKTEKEIDKEVFIISDDETRENNYTFVAQQIKETFTIPTFPLPLLPVPDHLLSFLLRVLGRSNTSAFRHYSSQKIGELGYRAKSPFKEALQRYLVWFKEQKGTSAEYIGCDL